MNSTRCHRMATPHSFCKESNSDRTTRASNGLIQGGGGGGGGVSHQHKYPTPSKMEYSGSSVTVSPKPQLSDCSYYLTNINFSLKIYSFHLSEL